MIETSQLDQITDPTAKAKELETLAQELRQRRVNYEKRWLIVDRFIDGKHFDTWNAEKNTFGTVKFPEGLNVRPIFYATKIMEGLLNNILNNDPRWQIYPININDADEKVRNQRLDYAKKLQDYFTSLWDIGNLTTQTIQLVWDGLKYGFGVFEVYWDDINNRPEVTTVNPYSILFDPLVKDIKESQWIIKEVSVPVEKIKYNPIYSDYKNEIKDDGELSGSVFERTRINEKYTAQYKPKVALVREIWIQNFQNGGWDLYHVCQGKLLYYNHYEFSNAPFASWSYLPEPLLQTSFFEKLIPLNRAIDLTLAQIEMWTRTVAVGRMLKKAGVNIKRISGETGEILEANAPLDSIQWLPVPEIGATPFNFLNELKGLAGESAAVMSTAGKVPSKKTGYKMIESLKAAEITSIQHSIRRLETTLENVATNILMFIYHFGTVPLTVQTIDKQTYEIVSAMRAQDFTNAVPVSDRDYSINVEIESGLAYTPDAKRALAIELAKAGMIDTKTALDYLAMGGDTSEIATKAINEMAQRESAKQGKAVSMIDTEDFKSLPPEMQQQILQYKLNQG